MTRSTRWSMVVAGAILTAGVAWGQTKPDAWSSKDTQGRAVTVPAATTSVLVFVRPDQPQSKKAIEQVSGALKDAKDVQVIAIISGDEAAPDKLGDKWSWPIVADPQYAASGKYAVRVWPTTVVVAKDGSLAAHIGGFPASFGKDLDAYVAFAGGKIDKATLDSASMATRWWPIRPSRKPRATWKWRSGWWKKAPRTKPPRNWPRRWSLSRPT